LSNLDSEQPADRSQVRHRILLADKVLVVIKNLLRSPGNHAVVNMDGENNNSRSRSGIEHPMVVVGMLETQVKKHLVECLVPSATGLLKAVDGLPKL